MKHNLLGENKNVRSPAVWAEATFDEFYFELSYPSDIAYPDAHGNIQESDTVLLIGFPADPFNDKINDPSRMHSLQSWFERVRLSKFYDTTEPNIVGHSGGVIPIKYNDGRAVPLTLAIEARISNPESGGTQRRSITLEEVLTFIFEVGNSIGAPAAPK